MGVKFQHNFRFLLKDNEKDNQAFSLTKTVDYYYISDTIFGYPVILIDTPGFADTDGVEEDKRHSNTITHNLKTKIQYLHAICFVSKNSSNRITSQ